jgi:hypothetical protein
VASLLSDTLWRVITFPVFYLLVFILIATALLQIRYVNRALQRFDSTQVIPTQFVLFTLSVIIGSAVLYRDFESTTAERMGKFVGGCFLTFAGVYLITSGRGKEDEEDEDEEDGVSQEGIHMVDEEEEYGDNAAEADGPPTKKSTPAGGGGGTFDTQADYFTNLSRHGSNASRATPRTPRRTISNMSSMASTPFNDLPESPLGENPWASSQEQVDSQNRLVPSSAQIRREMSSTSTRPGASRPTTPGFGPEVGQAPGASKEERRTSIFRKAMAFPGPLISPLSSSLSGIVQNDLRRGVDSPTRSMRRKQSGLSRLRSQQDIGDMFPESRASLPRSTSHDPNQGQKPRSLSISNALGSLFRSKSSRNKGSSGDEESGVHAARDEEQDVRPSQGTS